MALAIRRAPTAKVRAVITLLTIAALFLQPLLALNIPTALATTASISKITFVTAAQTIDAGEISGVFTVQTQNNGGNSKQLDTHNNILTVESSSPTGQFVGSVSGIWSAPGLFTMSSGTANRSFYYKDSTPGVHTLVATLSANGGAKILTGTQTVVVAGVVPAVEPVLATQDFATWDNTPSFRGFNVGFAAHNFGTVTGVTIDILRDDGSHVTRTAGPDMLAELSDKTVPTNGSAPFVIEAGTSTGLVDSSWWSGQTNLPWTSATMPKSATITVVGENGTRSVTNSIFLQGDNPAHPSYESMLPVPVLPDTVAPAIPSARFYDNNGSERPHTGWSRTKQFKFQLATPVEDGTTGYQVRYWNDIEGSGYKDEGNAWSTTVGSDGIYNDQFTQGEGIHYFSFRARDEAGNWSDYSAPFKIGYDATNPAVEVTSLHEGDMVKPNSDGKIVVRGSFNDAVSGANYAQIQLVHKGNSAGFVTKHGAVNDGVLAEFDLSALPDGSEYYIAYNAVDGAGNVVEWQRINFTLDSTAPAKVTGMALYDADNQQVASGYTNSYGVTVKWDNVGDAARYEYCYWNNVATSIYREANCYTTYPTSNQQSGVLNQGEGVHFVKARAIDAAGNIGEWSDTLSFVYDKTAPVIVANIDDGDTVKGIADLTMTLDGEQYPRIYNIRILDTNNQPVQVNGQNVGGYDGNRLENNYTYSFDTTKVSDGTYRIQFSARDSAGNPATTVFRTITVDNTAPASLLNPIPSSSNTSRTISGITEPFANIEVTVHSNPQTKSTTADASGNWSLLFEGLEPGDHTVRVVITDPVGNSIEELSTFTVFALSSSVPATSSSAPSTEGETPRTAVFEQGVLGGSQILGSIFESSEGSAAAPDNNAKSNSAILGEQDQEGTPLTDTGEVLGIMDHKFFGLLWYWYLIILIAVVGGWLLLAAAIRRRRQEA